MSTYDIEYADIRTPYVLGPIICFLSRAIRRDIEGHVAPIIIEISYCNFSILWIPNTLSCLLQPLVELTAICNTLGHPQKKKLSRTFTVF